MKKITIELWLPDEEEVNDENVGKALGIAIMANNLKYSTVPYVDFDDLKEDKE